LIEGKDERHAGGDYERHELEEALCITLLESPHCNIRPSCRYRRRQSPARSRTRAAPLRGHKRADDLWDLEAHLTDIKPFDYRLSSGNRPAGQPVHDMWIRLTVDRRLAIVDALVLVEAMPYAGACSAIAQDYGRDLVGLNLERGFRKAVQARFAKVAGCTHLNEVLAQFPTAAIQALAGERVDNEDDGSKPFQLDQCHALDTRGETVRRYYPRWYRNEAVRSGETQ
jgi:hypothetical protein